MNKRDLRICCRLLDIAEPEIIYSVSENALIEEIILDSEPDESIREQAMDLFHVAIFQIYNTKKWVVVLRATLID